MMDQMKTQVKIEGTLKVTIKVLYLAATLPELGL